MISQPITPGSNPKEKKMLLKKAVRRLALNKFFYTQSFENFIALLSPGIASMNVGDQIINEAVVNELKSLFPEAYLGTFPTKTPLNSVAVNCMNTAALRFVGGTNILLGVLRHRVWTINALSAWKCKPSILFGAGWGTYLEKTTIPVKIYYNFLLDRKYIHSVRDSYTMKKLQQIGFSNVLNTACPTTWNLTPQFCKTISPERSNSAVITLTDYSKNPERDLILIKSCLKHYDSLFFFPQSIHDISYFKSLISSVNSDYPITILPPSLESYDRLLAEKRPEYIGTRLHGGIRALQHRCRALILSIDNRANEMGKDIDLPIISTSELESSLPRVLTDGWNIDIKIPQKDIENWKNQFLC